ncbi:hypothetical protein NM208_g12977 [Fusarium decemcellulare]|uniref:Uncharacterized protein n=1 Tax=Fusarium decemcellulare TaxID=57161 RepID=A0ACC1RLK8_9HYPO|nr:hypothetical protein NM208_g12977 [Fusarium decemcellulare]
MLRTLILQLSNQLDDGHKLLYQLYDQYPYATPPEQALMDCLHQLVRRFRDVYVVIDALDESPRDTHREPTLQALSDLRDWSEPGLHLIVSSRDEVDIREELDVFREEIVEMRNKDIDRDITSFVSQHLQENRRLRKWAAYHEKIEVAIAKRARGMFRWVECQFKALASCPESEDLLEKVLDSLPQTLDETYARMLSNIPQGSSGYARQILALLCCARRPLTLDELVIAVAFQPEEDPRFNPKCKLMNIDAIHQVCPGLIELDINPYNQVKTVRLAHFSVREYLESGRILGHERAAPFGVQLRRAHTWMASICLVFLLNRPASTSKHQQGSESALSSYATRHWVHHFLNGSNSLRVEDQAFRLFTSTDGVFQSWANAWDAGKCMGLIPSPLCYSSLLGLKVVVEKILDKCEQQRESENISAAVQAASTRGHGDIIELLVKQGADVNWCDTDGRTSLHQASEHGHASVIQLLVREGANINARDTQGETALYHATIRGDKTIMQLLLAEGADADIPNNYGELALHEACFQIDEVAIQILLDGGANINAQDEVGETALHEACLRGDLRIVQILLGKGADSNARKYTGETTLHIASEGYFRGTIIDLLLDNSVSINAQDNLGETALYVAVLFRNESVVQQLLNNGADPDADPQLRGMMASIPFTPVPDLGMDVGLQACYVKSTTDAMHKVVR